MHKTIRLLRTFYSNFLLLSLLITFGCGFIYWTYGIGTFTTLFWLKLITLGIIYFSISTSKSKIQEFYYYQNLGVSKRLLWGVTFSFDFALFVLLLIIIHYIK